MRRAGPDQVALRGVLACLIAERAVGPEVHPDPRVGAERGGFHIALGVVEGSPPVVNDDAKRLSVSFGGGGERGNASCGGMSTVYIVRCTQSLLSADVEDGGPAGSLADEAVQAELSRREEVHVVEPLATLCDTR